VWRFEHPWPLHLSHSIPQRTNCNRTKSSMRVFRPALSFAYSSAIRFRFCLFPPHSAFV
jgi:hypothetical protein